MLQMSAYGNRQLGMVDKEVLLGQAASEGAPRFLFHFLTFRVLLEMSSCTSALSFWTGFYMVLVPMTRHKTEIICILGSKSGEK